MKQIILSLITLCSAYAAQAQSCVTLQQVSANYATKQVTFDLKWGTCNNANHLYRVWVFVDYRPVTNVMKGAWGRATIVATDKGTLVSANKGVWITGSANTTQRVTLTLDVIGDKFDWCAFATDCPPNATMSNGTYTLKGTAPFIVNGIKLGDTQTTYTGNCISSITDATNNPEGTVIGSTFSAGTVLSTGQSLCIGDTPTVIGSSATASGGDGSYTYQWRRNDSVITGATGTTYTPPASDATAAAAHTYTRWAKDETCNTAYQPSAGSWVLTVNPIPGVPEITGGGEQCGGTMILTATADVSGNGIRWTDNNSAYGSRTVGSGTYYAVSRSAAGCESSPVSVTVTINPIPGVPTMSGGGTQCGGTRSITATTGTGGNGIRWTDNSSTTGSRTVTGTGTYYAVSRNAAGCESGAAGVTVTIVANPAVPTVTNNGNQCAGTAITFTAKGGGSNVTGYNWTGSVSGNGASKTTATTAGNYSVQARSYITASGITCYSGYSAAATGVIVPVPSVPTVSDNGNKCAGTAITFTASGGGSNVTGYDWTGSVSGNGASKTTATTAGNYSVQARTYYTASGITCYSGYSGAVTGVIVGIPAVPTVANNGNKCAGTAITFTASASGVTGYEWTGSVSGTGTTKTTATTAGNYSAQARSYYTASGVTCYSGYSGSSSANIYAIPSPSISSGTTSIQVNATTAWTGSPAGGTWGTANSSIATVSSGVVTGKAVGSTNITYSVTTNGCTGSTSRAITVTSAAPPGSSNWTNCSGFSYISNVSYEGSSYMNWSSANTYCQNKGMRLPTRTELECMCSNKASLPGGYGNYEYWSSTPHGSYYYNVYFVSCSTNDGSPSGIRYVKCVK